jgi:hypothetical protein
VKFVNDHPFADADAAARKLVEIANTTESVQDGRIHIELINDAFLNAGGTSAEYRAGLDRAITKGWLWRHESGTYLKFTRGRVVRLKCREPNWPIVLYMRKIRRFPCSTIFHGAILLSSSPPSWLQAA